MKLYYLYILKCSDNSYYTGVTNDLEKRFNEHQSGDDPKSYVYTRRPLKLVWSEYYNDIKQAIEKEKQIKGWTRKKKEALINDDFDMLVELSKNSTLRQSFDRLRMTKDDILLNSKKFVITGPESSGKTTLAHLLAKEYVGSLVNEYAREYIEKLDRSYELEDVLIMAKEQLKREENSTGELIFLDTDLTVYAVWIKEKYNQEIDWIEEYLQRAKNKIYLLCDIDVDWEKDELREHPNFSDRKRLLEDYKSLFKKYKLAYHIISGDIPSRIKNSKEIINQFI